MTEDNSMSDLEIAVIAALAKHGDGMTNWEKYAYRMGFMDGAQHGMDTARKEMRQISAEREFP